MDSNELAVNSIHSAVYYYKNDNYGRAFAHFLLVFELDPQIRKLYRDEFVYTLREWGLELEKRRRLNDLCKCYRDGLNYFPVDVDIIKNYIVHLVKMDSEFSGQQFTTSFLSQFLSEMSTKGLLFEKLMQSVSLDLVSRWHFRMVNDYERNMAYYKSLLSFSSEKPVKVLDIGAGAGLLSLFASNSPNVHEIYAIESEEVLVEVAKKAFKDNYTRNVHVINRKSNMLTSLDIDGRADLVVTEIFDAALFGEHSLTTLEHAWEELLDENAKIIPHSADLFITGIQSDKLLRRYRVVEEINLLKDTVIINKTDEPYDAENLKMIDWKRISDTRKILNVDFSSLSQMKSLLEGKKIPVNLTCLCDGQVDAFAMWFNLYLDESISITTNPAVDNVKCWEQAIFRIDFPQVYKEGDEISLKFSCAENRATLEHLDTRIIPKHFPVNSEVITFLNDTIIRTTIENLAKKYDESVLTVLDYSVFPLFGILLAQHGSTCNYIFQDEYHSSLISHVFDINEIPPMQSKALQYLESDENGSEFSNFDVILFDVITINGTLDADMYTLLRDCISSLQSGKQAFPNSVKLICEVIESDYVPYCSRANDDNAFAFKIANHLNTFAVEEQWMLTRDLQHRKLTSKLEIEILRDDSEPLISEHLLPVIQKGKTDGVLYWFELSYGDNLKINTLESSHYNIACFLLHKNDLVYENNYVKLAVRQHCGFLKIFFNC